MKPGKFRLRKTSDIPQEHLIYEIVDEDQNILLDVTKTMPACSRRASWITKVKAESLS